LILQKHIVPERDGMIIGKKELSKGLNAIE